MALAQTKPLSWIVTVLVPTLQKLMDKHDAWTGLADEDAKGLNMLIAVGGELFALQDDWAVISPREGYASVGSGSATANGALHATSDLADCKKRCYKAVKAASHHVPTVAEPVQYIFVKTLERDK
jgi:ATP-dependent protease HslVU (ClpYQ) peptidase subunit